MTVDVNGNYNAQAYAPQYSQRVQYSRKSSAPQFGQSEPDSFEHTGGFSLGKGLMYGTVGAVGAGAAGYFLNGNPITETDGKIQVNEKFYQAYDNAIVEREVTETIKTAETEAIQKVGVASREELEALKKLAAAENLEALPEEVKKALPKNITTPEAAKELVQKAEAEIGKIDKTAIVKTVKENLANTSSKAIMNDIKNLTSFEEGLKNLPKEVTPEELKKFVMENRELIGIKGEEAEITKEIEEVCKKGREALLKEVQEGKVDKQAILNEANETILKNVNKETKSLIEGAPDYLKNAFKEFKWSQAKKLGLWGAGIAAGTYFISSLFSGSKKA